METALYPHFLGDPAEYASSAQFWVGLWNQIERFHRDGFGWSYPWLETGSPSMKDGNPIFSARSGVLRRGVRIVQLEPLGPGLDFQVWLDTFGGDITNPRSINELVIACVLSDEASRIAFGLISQWIQGLPVSIDYVNGHYLVNPRGVPLGFETAALEYAA